MFIQLFSRMSTLVSCVDETSLVDSAYTPLFSYFLSYLVLRQQPGKSLVSGIAVMKFSILTVSDFSTLVEKLLLSLLSMMLVCVVADSAFSCPLHPMVANGSM